MSREVIIRIRDDLDRSDADETISFSYRGVDYEIDLSSANVERFDKSVEEFIKVARTVERAAEVAPRQRSGKPAAKYPPISRATKQQRKDIRAWANANGFKVQDRGMIGSGVVEAFQLANPHVTLLPDTVPHHQYSARTPVIEKVSASDAQDGLIEASELLTKLHDTQTPLRPHRDQHAEKATKAQREKIRKWANTHGFEQGEKGIVKREVYDAYYKAHPKERTESGN